MIVDSISNKFKNVHSEDKHILEFNDIEEYISVTIYLT